MLSVGNLLGRTDTMRTRTSTLPLGTVSDATLRLEDLIPAVLGALSTIRLTKGERITCHAIAATSEHASEDAPYWAEDAHEDYETLCTIAESHVPDYCYFGSIEGDGACIGVWPCWEQLEDDTRAHHGYIDPKDYRDRDAGVTKISDTCERTQRRDAVRVARERSWECDVVPSRWRTWSLGRVLGYGLRTSTRRESHGPGRPLSRWARATYGRRCRRRWRHWESRTC